MQRPVLRQRQSEVFQRRTYFLRSARRNFQLHSSYRADRISGQHHRKSKGPGRRHLMLQHPGTAFLSADQDDF